MAIHDRGTPEDTQRTNGPCWLIREDEGHGGLLTVELAELGTVLPVFGGQGDALDFMEATLEPGLRVPLRAVQVARAQLASALLSSLSDVDRVLFVPSSDEDFQSVAKRDSLCRGSFVDAMLGRGRIWSTREEHNGTPWISRGAALKL
jgi:hypothetical protein